MFYTLASQAPFGNYFAKLTETKKACHQWLIFPKIYFVNRTLIDYIYIIFIYR